MFYSFVKGISKKYVKQQENLLNMTCINICEYMKNSNKYKNMFLKINYFYIKINK